MERKFKVGDTVRVKKNSAWYEDQYNQGKYYILNYIRNGHKSDHPKASISGIWGDLGSIRSFPIEHLELARIKDTKIARKMKKDQIDKIEDGWIYLK